jgi:hypothetical protein
MATDAKPQPAPVTEPAPVAAPPREYNYLAGVLSYLVPGLGQITQGRVGKGVLFLVCIYTLFFYGMFLGSGTVQAREPHGSEPPREYRLVGSVYLPDTYDERGNANGLPRVVVNLYNRPQFVAQFWVGLVVWPALWQYAHFDPRNPEQPDPLLGTFMRQPSDETLNAVHTSSDKLLDLGWVFTVIAGVLNVMVIYDAIAGPAFPPGSSPAPKPDA